MATLTIELSGETWERLRQAAQAEGKDVAALAGEVLADHLPPRPSEPPTVEQAMRAAGLLAELGPEARARAARCTVSHEAVRAALDQAGPPLLSEIVDDMRGARE